MSKVLILGVGNVLLKDEGIGVHVIETMAQMQMPENVTLVNGGVSGIDLLDVIGESDRLIIVDAMDAGEAPGSIFRFNADEVKMMLDEHKTSLHQVDLFDTLKIADFLDRCPETVIIGIQPEEIMWGLEPTSTLSGLIPKIIDLVISEVHSTGV